MLWANFQCCTWPNIKKSSGRTGPFPHDNFGLKFAFKSTSIQLNNSSNCDDDNDDDNDDDGGGGC